MQSLRMLFHPQAHVRHKIAFLALLVVLVSSFTSVTGALAQGSNGLGVGSGHGPEIGVNLPVLNQIKADIASGVYDRACTPQEHDRHKWHTLVDPVLKCHYDHHHGDDPNYVSDIFGEPGAWFGVPGQSLSYPWQTFPAQSKTEGNEQHIAQGTMENDIKHEGYMWVVRRDQPCQAGDGCITDFRLQVHAIIGAHDATVRWHSYSLELRVCADGNRPETCGIARHGGWTDTGRLFITPENVLDCSHSTEEIFISLPADTQFYPLDRPESRDEARCHPTVTQLPAYPSPKPIVEWWTFQHGRARFQLRSFDPIGNIKRDAPAEWSFYCTYGDTNCRYNQTIMSVWIGYVYTIPEFPDFGAFGHIRADSNGDGKADFSGFTNRFGELVGNCTTAGLDCVPIEMNGMTLNAFPDASGRFKEGNYVHHPCESCERVDYDLSPAGKQWNTWFFTKYADQVPPPPPPTEPSVVVKVDPQTASPGETVNVAMELHNVTELYGLQVECTVNSAVLNGAELVKGAFDDSNSFYVDSGFDSGSGRWMVAASRLASDGQSAGGINGNATAFTLRYSVQAAGDSGLNCGVLAVDANGNALDLKIVNGTLITNDGTVPPPPPPTPMPMTPTPVPGGASTVAGTIQYQNRATNAGITVELYQVDTQSLVESVVTGEDGTYSFGEVPAGSYGVLVKAPQHIPAVYMVEVMADGSTVNVEEGTLRAGDVNDNGSVEIGDATFVGANFGLEVIPEIAQGDLNADGLINITDLVLVGGNFGLTSPIPAQQ